MLYERQKQVVEEENKTLNNQNIVACRSVTGQLPRDKQIYNSRY
jgi:hypothetical protein